MPSQIVGSFRPEVDLESSELTYQNKRPSSLLYATARKVATQAIVGLGGH